VIRLAAPLLGPEEAAAAAEVLASGWLVQGSRVAEFEALLAEAVGVKHCVACSSGTAAIQMALAALELPAGARVALPDLTFPATINAVLLAGLEPVLLDVDPGTYNLRADEVEALLADAPPAVLLPVHQFGLPAPLAGLLDAAAAAGTVIVEDAACALGSSLDVNGRAVPAGAIGAMGCFSFHPRKVITTGEGGAVTTNDAALAERLRLLRNHGMVRPDDGPATFVRAGWNFRLSELHAAVGVVQMGRLPGLLEDRARIAAGYERRLRPMEGRGLSLPTVPPGATPNWQSYVVRVPEGVDQDAVAQGLVQRGVQCTISAQALHLEPAYRDLPAAQRALPGAEDARRRGLSLPVASGLTDEELDVVAEALSDVLTSLGA
jgi:perosamine synthetase